METDSKVCFRCNILKPLAEFYKHSQTSDGYLNKCKECTKVEVKNKRQLNMQNPEFIKKERARNRGKYHRLNYKDKYNGTDEAKRNYRERNADKYKAHNAVNNAIRDGILIPQPCRVCRNPEVEAHHPDYSKPLEVDWLCTTHHAEEHVRIREQNLAA